MIKELIILDDKINYDTIYKNKTFYCLDPNRYENDGFDDNSFNDLLEISKEYFAQKIGWYIRPREGTYKFYIDSLVNSFYLSVKHSIISLYKHRVVLDQTYFCYIKVGVTPSLNFIKDRIKDAVDNQADILADSDEFNFAILNIKKILEKVDFFKDMLDRKSFLRLCEVKYYQNDVNDFCISKSIDAYFDKAKINPYIYRNWNKTKFGNEWLNGFGRHVYVYNTESYIDNEILINDIGERSGYYCKNGKVIDKHVSLNEIGNEIAFQKYFLVSSGFFSFWILKEMSYQNGEIVFFDINSTSLFFKFFLLSKWPGPKHESFEKFLKTHFKDEFSVGMLSNFESILPTKEIKSNKTNFKDKLNSDSFWQEQANLWKKELQSWNNNIDSFQEIYDKIRESFFDNKIKFINFDISSKEAVENVNFLSQNDTVFLWISNIFTSRLLYNTKTYFSSLRYESKNLFEDTDYNLYKRFKENYADFIKAKHVTFGVIPSIHFYDPYRKWKNRMVFTQSSGFLTNLDLDDFLEKNNEK